MTDVQLPSDRAIAARPDVTQATAIEQARAVAEVQAAVVVAQQVPRDLAAALTAMRESCNQVGLADRAFFKFPRAGKTVTGPSVHLARELARCWGNVQYGVQELRRDDTGGYSEMQAWAWDVQTNTRSMHVFVVPHRKDTKRGTVDITDLRDIYENNANQGARRLREAIFSILPTWFTEEAKAISIETLARGDSTKTFPQQVAQMVSAFGETFGVSATRLEARFGPKQDWTPHDLAQMRVIGASLKQGTVSVEDEFPTTVTADDIADLTPKETAATDPDPATDPDAPVDDDWPLVAQSGSEQRG